MSSMPRIISIIIPIHNSIEYTKNALRDLYSSIREVNDPAWQFEVVVVDDGSEDGSSDWISKHYPGVNLCKGNGNLWWSGSMNLGIKYAIDQAGADYILWWNNDIFPDPVYFKNLIMILNGSGYNTVYGSKIYVAEEPEVIWSYGGKFHSKWGHSYMPENFTPDRPEFQQPSEADWLPGMGTILPVHIIKAIGDVNAIDFPQYHGDVDYTYRCKLSGFRIEVRPELKIWNHTTHSGMRHTRKLRGLITALRSVKSNHNFAKEWLLYRKYSKNPLAYLMLMKKYIGYLIKFPFRSGN